jgi:hypothetical protein
LIGRTVGSEIAGNNAIGRWEVDLQTPASVNLAVRSSSQLGQAGVQRMDDANRDMPFQNRLSLQRAGDQVGTTSDDQTSVVGFARAKISIALS